MILIDKRGIINPSGDYTEELTTLTQAWELRLDVSTAGNSHITIILFHHVEDFFFLKYGVMSVTTYTKSNELKHPANIRELSANVGYSFSSGP